MGELTEVGWDGNNWRFSSDGGRLQPSGSLLSRCHHNTGHMTSLPIAASKNSLPIGSLTPPGLVHTHSQLGNGHTEVRQRKVARSGTYSMAAR
jgi:hypothetical protein